MGTKRLLGYGVMKSKKTPIPGSGASTHLHVLYDRVEEAEQVAADCRGQDERSTYTVEPVYVEI